MVNIEVQELAKLRISQVSSVTLADLSNTIEAAIGQFWPNSWTAIFSDLQRLANADQGGPWRHTLGDVAIMNVLIAGPQHPDWRRVVKPLTGQPDLIAWITQNGPRFEPDLLRVMALVHDLGKGISYAGHEELSFRLLKQALGRDLQPGSDEALIGLVLRHHATFGDLETGAGSYVALLTLIDDRRHYNLDLEQLLAALILLTIAEWALYDVLTAATMRRFLTYADFLRQEFWWTHAYQEVKLGLWQEAIRKTAERLSNLVTYGFVIQPLEDHQQLAEFHTLVETIASESSPNWPDFQGKFALIRLEAGHAVFPYCLELISRLSRPKITLRESLNPRFWLGFSEQDQAKLALPSLEHRVTFAMRQLNRWLPSPEQVKAFEDGQTPLYSVNLRPVAENLSQKNLQQIEAKLANRTIHPTL